MTTTPEVKAQAKILHHWLSDLKSTSTTAWFSPLVEQRSSRKRFCLYFTDKPVKCYWPRWGDLVKQWFCRCLCTPAKEQEGRGVVTSTGNSAPLLLSQSVCDAFVDGSLLHYPNPFQALHLTKRLRQEKNTHCNEDHFQPCPWILWSVSCPKMSKLSGFLAPTQVKGSTDKMNSVLCGSVHLPRWATWYELKGVHSHAEDTFTDYSENQRPREGEGWVVRSQPCGKECEPTGWEDGLANVRASSQETAKENSDKAKIQSQNLVRLRQ